jgi:hypothetical protein
MIYFPLFYHTNSLLTPESILASFCLFNFHFYLIRRCSSKFLKFFAIFYYFFVLLCDLIGFLIKEMKIISQNYFFESNHFTLIINFKMINFLMTKNLFNSFRNLINHQANRMKESYLLPKFFSFFMNLFKY